MFPLKHLRQYARPKSSAPVRPRIPTTLWVLVVAVFGFFNQGCEILQLGKSDDGTPFVGTSGSGNGNQTLKGDVTSYTVVGQSGAGIQNNSKLSNLVVIGEVQDVTARSSSGTTTNKPGFSLHATDNLTLPGAAQ